MADIDEVKIRKYYSKIYKFVYMQVKNREDAQDITQEVFYQYFDKNIVFPDVEREKAWLFTVARNKCKNHWRTCWYRKIFDEMENISEPKDISEKEYERKEDAFYVVSCVSKLPYKYREIIHLFYYENMSIEKISKITGKNKSTIQTQLDRGRKLLKKIMIK